MRIIKTYFVDSIHNTKQRPLIQDRGERRFQGSSVTVGRYRATETGTHAQQNGAAMRLSPRSCPVPLPLISRKTKRDEAALAEILVHVDASRGMG